MTAAPPVASVTVGTRRSELARTQTKLVLALLSAAWPGLAHSTREIVTTGDRTQAAGRPLPEIGGKGLFTAELEQALRDGEIDLAVHSLKDLPTEEPPGIVVGAVCLREDVRDCLVARERLALADLDAGAVVGTSSLRRAAQLRVLRSDLEVRSIRGNVDTRIRKVREGEYDAAVLAAAGVHRLGLEGEIAEYLWQMLPAPGQGALAVQCRAGDERVRELLAAVEDPGTRAATTAERMFLRALGAGCTAPVAAHAEVVEPDAIEPSYKLSQGEEGSGARVHLVAMVASVDGSRVVRVEGEGEPEEVGVRLGHEALARGADAIVRAEERPLAGRRVVVTRPAEHAGPLVESLNRRGAEATVVPLISIEPVEDASPLRGLVESGEHDWIVFTSANAVRALVPLLAQSTARTAAVGPVTAKALREVGIEPAFVPARFAAEEIAVGLEPLEGARVLLPQSEIAEPLLADELRARGASVDVVDAYRTVERAPTEDELAVVRSADAVLLASGSAARALASAVWPGDEALATTLVACIGPTTAEAAREAGLRVDLVAEEATGEGMIGALVAHLRDR